LRVELLELQRKLHGNTSLKALVKAFVKQALWFIAKTRSYIYCNLPPGTKRINRRYGSIKSEASFMN
jgi:hypothetical protein